jgi:hypothetical protein
MHLFGYLSIYHCFGPWYYDIIPLETIILFYLLCYY